MYISPYVIPKDNFATSDINQFEASTSGWTLEVQSIIPKEMKGGIATKEIFVAQEDAHLVEQTKVVATRIQEQL